MNNQPNVITKRFSFEPTQGEQHYMPKLNALLAPSYVDPGPLLKRELARNTEIYLALDTPSTIAAFFLVGWDLSGPSDALATVYLGLSGCREDYKGTGLTIRLYREFIRDAQIWEIRCGHKLVLWATTAHPLVWTIFHRLFCEVTPSLDGGYSLSAAERAVPFRAAVGRAGKLESHPFVFRELLADTRYSASEQLRCDRARRKLAVDVFQQLDIQEQRGDRLLLLGSVPSGRAKTT
jgi:hypothetical protein